MEKMEAIPAVSVVIPLYNSEKYIGECLDSILAQTFQNFEVIVVDDCSTDKSVEIVKSYAPKFNGRLTLTKLEKNSGSGAMPRNKGMMLSRGEYIQCLDADDMFTETAIEEMYTLAKEYDADVIFCERIYDVDNDGSNCKLCVLQEGILADKPELESDNLQKRLTRILQDSFIGTCSRFVRRNFILENEIFFQNLTPSEDNIWNQNLLFYAEKFLRVPNIIYIRRLSENSVMRTKRTPQQRINFWLNPVLLGLKTLDKMMGKIEFFQKNPRQRYAVLEKFALAKLNLGFYNAGQLSTYDVYSTIKDEFGGKFGEHDVLIPALCAAFHAEKKARVADAHNVLRNFTARIDIKLVPKGAGDFKIFSVSDDKAKVSMPAGINKNGIAYAIQSCAGNLKFVAKTEADGKIYLSLRGILVRDPADNSKRLPSWIDYTSLAINGNTVLNERTPAWHDKPYRHNIEVKAGDEITVEVEWLPHRSDT